MIVKSENPFIQIIDNFIIVFKIKVVVQLFERIN